MLKNNLKIISFEDELSHNFILKNLNEYNHSDDFMIVKSKDILPWEVNLLKSSYKILTFANELFSSN